MLLFTMGPSLLGVILAAAGALLVIVGVWRDGATDTSPPLGDAIEVSGVERTHGL
jgi:hypothetical protein